jgi:hypothetical protein
MLQVKTKEQEDYVKSLVEKESCDGDVTIYDDSVNYRVDSCFDVDISFDTMAKIVDYLRKENEDVEIPTTCSVSADSDGVVYDLRNTPHDEVMQFCKKLAWVKGKDFGYYYEQYIANGRIVIQNK